MAAEEAPKIKLYWLEHSRSQRILWLLEELKLPYEMEIFHRDKKTMFAGPDLEKIHPLGKSPMVSFEAPGAEKPVLLAESGFIAQYLTEHAPEGKRLMPKKWREGLEGKFGGETEEWLRYQYYLHYTEGSLMSILMVALVVGGLKSTNVPFFIQPISSMIANQIFGAFVMPNMRKNLKLLERDLSMSSGKYLCGGSLTAVDILLSFPLLAARDKLDGFGKWEGGSWKTEFPKVCEYTQVLESEDGYVKCVEKIRELEGNYAVVP